MAALEIHSPEKKTDTQSNQFAIFLLWILATAIGWSAGVFDLNSTAETYTDVARLLLIYLGDGLLIGFVLGIGQALVLKRFTRLNWEWAKETVLGYGLAFLMGLVVSISIPSIIWELRGEHLFPFAQPSTVSIWFNMDDLFWGGFLIGPIQWQVLKTIIPNPSREKALLWMLANWFVFGSSLFVRAFTHGTTLASFQMTLMGIVMGIVTGGILLTFLSNSHLAERELTK
jgi:hypothetical protein